MEQTVRAAIAASTRKIGISVVKTTPAAPFVRKIHATRVTIERVDTVTWPGFSTSESIDTDERRTDCEPRSTKLRTFFGKNAGQRVYAKYSHGRETREFRARRFHMHI